MRQRRSRKFLKFKLFFSVGLLIVFLSAVFSLKFLTIQKVEVQNTPSCIGDFKLPQMKALLGQNFFLVNKKNIEEDIQKRYICVDRINLKKQFPSSIKVEIIERQAKLAIVNIDQEATGSSSVMDNLTNNASESAKFNLGNFKQKDTFLADENGVIFLNSAREDLPKVYSWVNFKLGQKLENDLTARILKVYEKLNLFRINTASSLLNSDGTYLMYSNPRVYFNLKGNIDLQLASLQLILKTAKINHRPVPSGAGIDKDFMFIANQGVYLIDLRFDKPIIKFAPETKKE